jgi:hypothetical protein
MARKLKWWEIYDYEVPEDKYVAKAQSLQLRDYNLATSPASKYSEFTQRTEALKRRTLIGGPDEEETKEGVGLSSKTGSETTPGNVDPERITSDYVYNINTIFKGLKMPNFSKTSKVVTTKPKENLMPYVGLGVKPLQMPMTVYQYKKVDPETGTSVIMPQKEIEVVAQNENNYYYYQDSLLKVISKEEVSDTPFDEDTLKRMYMTSINEKATQMRKNVPVGGFKNTELKGGEAQYEGSLWEQTKERFKVLLGEREKIYTNRGKEDLKAKDEMVSFLYGVTDTLSKPIQRLADYSLKARDKIDVKGTWENVKHKIAYPGEEVPNKKTTETTGYSHDPDYYRDYFVDSEGKKWVKDENGKKVSADAMYEKAQKTTTEAYPLHYSHETDAMSEGRSKEEIEAAKLIDLKEAFNYSLDRDLDAKVTNREQMFELAGNMAATILEIAGTYGLGSGASGLLKGQTAGRAFLRFLTKNAIAGGGYGFLESLEQRDMAAVDRLKVMAKEAAFFMVGEGASKGVTKGLEKVFFKKILQTGLKRGFAEITKGTLGGLAFGGAGTLATAPFSEATAEEVAQQGLIMAGVQGALSIFGAAGKAFSKTKSLKTIAKKLTPEETAKVQEVINKYGLNKDVTKMSNVEKTKIANETKRNLIRDVGKKVIENNGTKNPEELMKIYTEKYNLPSNIKFSKDLKGANNFASIIRRGDSIELRINPTKSADEIAGSLRHEIEHVMDEMAGFVSKGMPTTKGSAKTVAELLNEPGHHGRFSNFEASYLESALGKEMQVEGFLPTDASVTRIMRSATEGTIFRQETGATRGQVVRTPAVNLPRTDGKKITKSSLRSKLYEMFVDRYYGVSRVGEKSKIRVSNYGKYPSVVSYINTKAMVGKDGRVINNKSLLDVIAAPDGLQSEFEAYLFHKHNIGRTGKGLPILGTADGQALSVKQTKSIVQEFDNAYPNFKNAADDLYAWIDDLYQSRIVDNLLPARTYKNMTKLYPNYVPADRNVKGNDLVKGSNVIGSNPVRRAKGGVDELKPLTESLPTMVDRIVRADQRNRVAQGILDDIMIDPLGMSEIAEVVKVGKKQEKELTEQLSRIIEPRHFDEAMQNLGNNLVSTKSNNYLIAMVKGEPVTLKIKDNMLWNALKKLNKSELSNIEHVIKFINQNVTQKFKNVTTVFNPFFAIKNTFKDMPTSYINGAVSNPLKYGRNLVSSAKSMVTKDGLAKQFMALGGTSGNITSAEQQITASLKIEKSMTRKKATQLLELLNFAGFVSESSPRLAEFKAVYDGQLKLNPNELEAIEKALFASGEVTVNFNRGGDVTKALDAIFPYINAGVQGTDRWIRSLFGGGKKGWATALKTVGAVTVPTVVFTLLNNGYDKYAYDQIPDYVKDNNYILPVGQSNGQNEYFKIPKARESSFFFSTIWEKLYRYMVNDDEKALNFKGLKESFSYSFYNPVEEFAKGGLFQTAIGISTGNNKDYFGRDIEPIGMRLKQMSKRNIYTDKTSKISVALGPVLEQFGLSPAQADYLITSYTGILGKFYVSFNSQDKSPEDTFKQISGFIYKDTGTKATNEEYEKSNEANRNVADYEAENGITKLKEQLRNEGLTSTNKINREIRNRLGYDIYDTWMSLKEKKKSLEKD